MWGGLPESANIKREPFDAPAQDPSTRRTQLDSEPYRPRRTSLLAGQPVALASTYQRGHAPLTMSWKMKYRPFRLSRVRTCAVLTLDPSSVR